MSLCQQKSLHRMGCGRQTQVPVLLQTEWAREILSTRNSLMCTAANTTAPRQSQDWYLIICVISTFCFQMSSTFVKIVQKQKAALRMTHLAQCRFGEGKINQKRWYFHVRSVKNIFPVFSPSSSNRRRTFNIFYTFSNLASGPFIPVSGHSCPLQRTAHEVLSPSILGYFAFRKSLFCKVSSCQK